MGERARPMGSGAVTHRRDWKRDYGHGNANRDEAGVIATLSDGSVIHCSGLTKTALRAIAAYCDRRELKVATVSTPRTIMADLAIRTTYLNGLGRGSRAASPEQSLLGQIGRIDLCVAAPLTGPSRRLRR